MGAPNDKVICTCHCSGGLAACASRPEYQTEKQPEEQAGIVPPSSIV